MFKRAIASCLFLAGGLVTWFVMTSLQTLSATMAGLSPGPVLDMRDREAAALFLLYSYFLLSAVSAIATSNKRALWMLWCFAHALALIAFCLACSEMSNWPSEKLISGILSLAAATGLYFSPWLAIWAWLLSRAKWAADPK